MGIKSEFRVLMWRSLAILAACVVLVCFCYLLVDRPVAFYVHEHGFPDHRILKWLTWPPPVAQAWTPLVLVVLAVRRCFGPFQRWELVIAAGCVAMLVADQFRDSLSYVFGRYWPETWIDDNPSLIQDGAYGFHPFHGGSAYGSFPSGHAARTLAVAAVVWIACPRLRWLSASVSAAIAVGLVGMNYHFVSDVIAGGVIGGIVGMYAAHACRLADSPGTS